MEYALVCAVALAASGLTLFSGFGLGTILFPAFALFFPADVAVAQTALVHMANNVFKLALFWRAADLRTALRFGVPAMAAALAGAWLLTLLSDAAPIFTYEALGAQRQASAVKLVLAGLMVFFAVAELRGTVKSGPARGGLVAGGLLSGFFGGLSGHQGAFRSAYLLKAGLSKEAFIATGVVLACAVDASRLAVYAGHLARPEVSAKAWLVAWASVSAFEGAWIGRKLVRKGTLEGVRRAVAWMMAAVALGLAAGFL